MRGSREFACADSTRKGTEACLSLVLTLYAFNVAKQSPGLEHCLACHSRMIIRPSSIAGQAEFFGHTTAVLSGRRTHLTHGQRRLVPI
jgi:hypothetical protein